MVTLMSNEIRVWDPVLRVFHWGLVLSFFISYITAEEESELHIYAGYVVLGLILFRLLWGVIGSKHARFRDFLYSPKDVILYLKELITGKTKHYVGHNPAGGWMIIALLISLFVVTISGLKVYAIEEGLGPLAGVNTELPIISSAHADWDEDDDDEKEEYKQYSDNGKNDQDEEFWEEIHEASTNFTLFLIFLHITGVVVASKLHNENFVRAMITGKKEGVN